MPAWDATTLGCRFSTPLNWIIVPSGLFRSSWPPATHPLGHRLEIPLEGLSEDTWFVSSDDGVGWPGAFYEACRAAGFMPAVTHEFHVLDQLQSMIAKGLQVTAVQPTVCPVDGVLIKPLAGGPLWQRHLLLWRRDLVDASVCRAVHHQFIRTHRPAAGSGSRTFKKWVALGPARLLVHLTEPEGASWSGLMNSNVLRKHVDNIRGYPDEWFFRFLRKSSLLLRENTGCAVAAGVLHGERRRMPGPHSWAACRGFS
ncbi:LysR substrate-binding domain-containing protein [Streptomyces cavourensis]